MGTITNVGKAKVAGLINGQDTGPFTFMAIGTDDTPENVGQTALGAEITSLGGERVAAQCSRETTNVTNDTAEWLNVYSFTGQLTVNECGIFDSPSGGTMYMRHVFPKPKNVESGDTLTLTVKAVQTQG